MFLSNFSHFGAENPPRERFFSDGMMHSDHGFHSEINRRSYLIATRITYRTIRTGLPVQDYNEQVGGDYVSLNKENVE